MLVLYETPAGYALFKLQKSTISDDIQDYFTSSESTNKVISLLAFEKFNNTTEALSNVTALIEGKLSKNLKSFLDLNLKKSDTLVVADQKLASSIAKKMGVSVLSDSTTNELYRGIRSQIASLIVGLPEQDMNQMILGLSHSLSRYKLKFSPDKVDTMIIQAIALLDDLDKELNTYAMRAKEWYGWHFPEMAKLIVDNLAFAKTVKMMGVRTNCAECDLSSILPEELESALKSAAEVSMGTEISVEDIENITYLCDQIISITEYRTQLYDYLKNRMSAIAPNLTMLVGELVGARLISHAGSLLNLAKQPASTIQILGAEKALFRALKSKHDTPKYGLIYHASLVGQANPKTKGKIARTLSTKTAIAVRCDALGDGDDVSPEVGILMRGKVEQRLRQLEGKPTKSLKVSGPSSNPTPKKADYNLAPAYNNATDAVVSTPDADIEKKAKKDKKRKIEEVCVGEEVTKEASEKKLKKEKKKEKKEKKKDKQ